MSTYCMSDMLLIKIPPSRPYRSLFRSIRKGNDVWVLKSGITGPRTARVKCAVWRKSRPSRTPLVTIVTIWSLRKLSPWSFARLMENTFYTKNVPWKIAISTHQSRERTEGLKKICKMRENNNSVRLFFCPSVYNPSKILPGTDVPLNQWPTSVLRWQDPSPKKPLFLILWVDLLGWVRKQEASSNVASLRATRTLTRLGCINAPNGSIIRRLVMARTHLRVSSFFFEQLWEFTKMKAFVL